MISPGLIQHWDQHRREETESPDWLPAGEVTAGVTAGASCPNNLIEEVIERLFELKQVPLPELRRA
jgi:4-hydroxy-3-methylbut-2-enyl diphosphate reductase